MHFGSTYCKIIERDYCAGPEEKMRSKTHPTSKYNKDVAHLSDGLDTVVLVLQLRHLSSEELNLESLRFQSGGTSSSVGSYRKTFYFRFLFFGQFIFFVLYLHQLAPGQTMTFLDFSPGPPLRVNWAIGSLLVHMQFV